MNPDRFLYIPAGLFIAAVIGVQIAPFAYSLSLTAGLLLFTLLGKRASHQALLTVTAAYAAGFGAFVLLESQLQSLLQSAALPREAVISLSRLALLGFLLPFWLLHRFSGIQARYMAWGSFRESIYFPFIWKGIRDPIWRFLLIFAGISIGGFAFFVDWSQTGLWTLLGYGLLFAVINSVLEELLWRGYILSRFTEVLGEKAGLLFASAGFGFYHYSIGFPWSVCALFSIFGAVMGGVAIKSGGLLPVILMHLLMNILFVLAGIVF